MLAEIDAAEKRKDFGLSALASELQWRAEVMGRGRQDLVWLNTQASDAELVTRGGGLLGMRNEVEKKFEERLMESSKVWVDDNVEAMTKAILAAGKVAAVVFVNVRVRWRVCLCCVFTCNSHS